MTDFLLSHAYGAFLIESKALSLLTRDPLPERSQLTGDVIKHVAKATRQLSGALRNIRAGQKITNKEGRELHIERQNPPHAIILVPDLNLLHEEDELGPVFLAQFMKATGAFLHILDPLQLFRVVQAAAMIAARGQTITIIETLDYYLMQRFERALKAETPDFDMILRIEEPRHELSEL